MGNKTNVLVGSATLFINDADVGYTIGGVAIEHSAEFYDVEVDQEPNVIKSFKTKETFKIKTSLAELTLENMKIAMGIDSSIDASTYAGYRFLPFGGSSADPVEFTMDIYGNAPGIPARQRRIHFYRVIVKEFGTMTIEKNKEQVVPVTFEAMIDSDQADGQQIGYIKDQTVREYKNLRCRLTVA